MIGETNSKRQIRPKGFFFFRRSSSISIFQWKWVCIYVLLLHVPLAWWLEGCSFTAIFDKLCKASQKKVVHAVTKSIYTMSHQCFLQASWAQTAEVRASKPRKWLVGFMKESIYENHEAINTKVTKWNNFTELVLCTVIEYSYNLIRTDSLLVYLDFA